VISFSDQHANSQSAAYDNEYVTKNSYKTNSGGTILTYAYIYFCIPRSFLISSSLSPSFALRGSGFLITNEFPFRFVSTPRRFSIFPLFFCFHIFDHIPITRYLSYNADTIELESAETNGQRRKLRPTTTLCEFYLPRISSICDCYRS